MRRYVKPLMTVLLCGLALYALFHTPQNRPEDAKDRLVCYFATQLEKAAGKDAIASESVEESLLDGLDTEQQLRVLMRILLDGPQSDGLQAIFPPHTSLLDVSLTNYTARVNLSGEYGQLSGIDLSLADACVTLTLTQLPAVYRVQLLADGEELDYRDKKLLRGDDALLGSRENSVRTLPVTLWFWNTQEQELQGEECLLELREGDSLAQSLYRFYAEGAQGENQAALLPASWSEASVRVEQGVAYCNLPEDWETDFPEGPLQQQRVIEALTRTLCSLDTVESVQFLVAGEAVRYLGMIDLNETIVP